MAKLAKTRKIYGVAASTSRRGTLLSKPASGRATVERERDLRFDRRSTRGSAVRVDRRRLDRSRSVEFGFRFRPPRASPRLSRLADYFASADERRSQRRFVGLPRNIPLFRTALGSTFRPRSAEGASDSSRRRPDRRTSRFFAVSVAVGKCCKTLENAARALATRVA